MELWISVDIACPVDQVEAQAPANVPQLGDVALVPWPGELQALGGRLDGVIGANVLVVEGATLFDAVDLLRMWRNRVGVPGF
jgi:hypothetical protein